MGGQAAKYGRGPVLIASLSLMTFGLVLMTPDYLPSIALGLVVLTFGFFGAHAIASGWAPTLVDKDKAQGLQPLSAVLLRRRRRCGHDGRRVLGKRGLAGVALFSGAMMAGTIVIALLLWRIAPR